MSESSLYNNSNPAGSLEKNLATLLLQSASTIYNDTPIVHPVVCMNAIKNILGDIRDSPSEILLTYAENYIAGLKPREKDQKVLEDMPEDGIGYQYLLAIWKMLVNMVMLRKCNKKLRGSILRLMGVQPFWRFWLNWPCKM